MSEKFRQHFLDGRSHSGKQRRLRVGEKLLERCQRSVHVEQRVKADVGVGKESIFEFVVRSETKNRQFCKNLRNQSKK